MGKQVNKVFKGILKTFGMATPDSLKRQERQSQLEAAQAAAALDQANRNLEANMKVNLDNADQLPDVVAGGTADAVSSMGDVKRKKGNISTQLGIQV